jgi:Histidine kinase-like ATPase domain
MTVVDVPPRPGDRVEAPRAGTGTGDDFVYAFTLRTEPASVPAARTLAAEALKAWGVAADHPAHQAALLILTELTTNSVRHAAQASPEMAVTLGLHPAAGTAPRTVTLAVHDDHPRRPHALPHPRRDGTGGWGLPLVETLAHEWGGGVAVVADGEGGGKTVRVRLVVA